MSCRIHELRRAIIFSKDARISLAHLEIVDSGVSVLQVRLFVVDSIIRNPSLVGG